MILRATVVMVSLAIAAPAFAQPGVPEPATDLAKGTIVVRVIAGDPKLPVAGKEVTLVVAGAPRTARSAPDGSVTFSGLDPGARVQAKVTGDEGEMTSAEFAVPAEGGARVTVSTKPMAGVGSGMPSGHPQGGGGGMPQPRQISGQPRPDQADPPGSITVRLTYDDFSDPQPPANVDVHLVGYGHDGKITVESKSTDASGRVEFTGLDLDGDVAYYATALLPRNGTYDRVMSAPITMLPGVGMRLAMSGDKRTSTGAPVDDHMRFSFTGPTRSHATPAGSVAVDLVAEMPDQGGEVGIFDAKSGSVLAKAPVPATRMGEVARGVLAGFEPDPTALAGTLKVMVIRGTDARSRAPMANLRLKVVPVAGGGEAIATGTTDKEGRAELAVPAGAWKLIANDEVESDPFEMPSGSGARIFGAVDVGQTLLPRTIVLPDIASIEPVYAEVAIGNVAYRGLPFVPVPGRGTMSTILVVERIRYGFAIHGNAEDKYLGFSGRFAIRNLSWLPYRASPDGLLIPLPRGHVGGGVEEESEPVVNAEPKGGFRIRRPLPPNGFGFHGWFSLPIDDGDARFELDLPLGAGRMDRLPGSRILITDTPGMKVELPPTVDGGTGTLENGTQVFAIDGISIPPGRSIAMKITGLPTYPWWRVWLPRLAGGAVLVLVIGGLALALWTRRGAGTRAAANARIQSLLDELVELERAGQGGKRKQAILAELEKSWVAGRSDA